MTTKTLTGAVALAALAVFSLSACGSDDDGGSHTNSPDTSSTSASNTSADTSSSDAPADAAANVKQSIDDNGPDWASSVDDVASIMPGTVGVVVHGVSKSDAASICDDIDGWTGGNYRLAVESKSGSDLATCGKA